MTSELFRERVMDRLLPEFCDYPGRDWCRVGFQTNWPNVDDIDASNFIRAIDGGLVEHLGGGNYRAPKSLAIESFFWEGPKKTVPRRLTLWIEPVITVATLARLHFEFGWPKPLLGTQSLNYEFDATAYRSCDLTNEYVACEVKKSVSELNLLINLMQKFAVEKTTAESISKYKEINAYRKLKGLESRRAPMFWAVGPAGVNHVFRVRYGEYGIVTFEPADLEALAYPD